MERTIRLRVFRFVFILAMLLVMAAVLSGLMAICIHAAGNAGDEQARNLPLLLAWLSFAMVCLTLLIAAWVTFHFITERAKPRPHPPTQYVDAWALAGQRAQADDDEFDELTDDDEPPEGE